jgi:hypothetical protein
MRRDLRLEHLAVCRVEVEDHKAPEDAKTIAYLLWQFFRRHIRHREAEFKLSRTLENRVKSISSELKDCIALVDVEVKRNARCLACMSPRELEDCLLEFCNDKGADEMSRFRFLQGYEQNLLFADDVFHVEERIGAADDCSESRVFDKASHAFHDRSSRIVRKRPSPFFPPLSGTVGKDFRLAGRVHEESMDVQKGNAVETGFACFEEGIEQ